MKGSSFVTKALFIVATPHLNGRVTFHWNGCQLLTGISGNIRWNTQLASQRKVLDELANFLLTYCYENFTKCVEKLR